MKKKISVSYPGYFSTSKIKQYKIKKKKFFLEKEKFIYICWFKRYI